MSLGNKKVSFTIKKISINTEEDNMGRTIADMVRWSFKELKKSSDSEKIFPDFIKENET